MGKTEEGLIWFIDVKGHSKWPIEDNKTGDVLAYIRDGLHEMTLGFNWTASSREDDKVIFCCADASEEVIGKAIRDALRVYHERSAGFARELRSMFDVHLQTVDFNQFLFWGKFAHKGRKLTSSTALGHVCKYAEKALATPNVSLARGLVDRLPMKDPLLSAFGESFYPPYPEEADVTGNLQSFRCLLSPEIPAEGPDRACRFGVIPDLPRARHRDADAVDVVAKLRTKGICRVTGAPGVGKTSVALAALDRMEQKGYTCLWFNCWRLFTLEFFAHSLAHVFQQHLMIEPTFIVELLRYLGPKGWDAGCFDLLLDAMRTSGNRICIVLDNFNSDDIDDHVRGLFEHMANELRPSEQAEDAFGAASDICVLYVTTDGPQESGYTIVTDTLASNEFSVTVIPLRREDQVECLTDSFARLDEGVVDRLTRDVTSNFKLLRMLCGSLNNNQASFSDVMDIAHKSKHKGQERDNRLFLLILQHLGEQNEVVSAAYVLRPLLNEQLLAHLGICKTADEAETALEALRTKMCCLERYKYSGYHNWPYKCVYRVPPELGPLVLPDKAVRADLIGLAKDFFDQELTDLREKMGASERQRRYLRVYRAYRFAVFYRTLIAEEDAAQEQNSVLGIFEVARNWSQFLIDNGVVAERHRDVAACKDVVRSNGGPDQIRAFYVVMNRLWRTVFRLDESMSTTQEMLDWVMEIAATGTVPAILINAANLEKGVYYTMRRDYVRALEVFQDIKVDHSDPDNERVVRKMHLRIAQTYISLNKPVEAIDRLRSFDIDHPLWGKLLSWYNESLGDHDAVWRALREYPIDNGIDIRVLQTPSTQEAVLRLNGFGVDTTDREQRSVAHSFAMYVRHHTTLHFLAMKGEEALRSGLLGYMFNDVTLMDQTGRSVCLIQMAKILCELFREKMAREYADALIHRAIDNLHLRSQSLWWLACAYWAKGRIAIARKKPREAVDYINRLCHTNEAHTGDSWRGKEAKYLGFLLALEEKESMPRARELYEELFAGTVHQENSYLVTQARIEYGNALMKRGAITEALGVFNEAWREHCDVWHLEVMPAAME